MPRNVKLYDLLISCPGDVDEECGIIGKVVEKFNRLFGDGNNIRIDIKHWSKDSYPQSGGEPQALLNKQFVENCDITVAVFWTRFGTPTDKYESGTEEEIEKMLDQGKQVFLYFSDKPTPPSDIDSEQYDKVKTFKDQYKNKGIYFGYLDLFEFEQLLLNHLTLYFLKTIQESDLEKENINIPKLVVRGIDVDSISDVLLAKKKIYIDSQFFISFRQTIKEIFESVNKIILPDDSYDENIEGEKLGFGVNFGLSSLWGAREMQPVKFTDKKIEIIKNYARNQDLNMNEDFFYFADLNKPTVTAVANFGQPFSSVQGLDEAKEKYGIIEKLFYKINEYSEWQVYFSELQKYSSVLGLVGNVGREFDEDIDVRIKIPKGHVCDINDLPIPGRSVIEAFNHSHLEETFFKCKKEVFFENYSGYPFNSEIPSYPGIPFSYLQKSAEEEYSEQIDIYETRIKEIYCYEIFSDKEYDVLVFNIDYLKQNTNMIFPSKLFFSEIPDIIFYEIRSKYFPEVVNGSIEVKKDLLELKKQEPVRNKTL